MSVKGFVFSVTRGSFHDGPGVRDVVYLKGCPLACLWCHNPEGQSGTGQLCYSAVKCIGCRSCVENCPRGNFTVSDSGLKIDFANCAACGKCVDGCPGGALTLYGESMTSDEIIALLMRDRHYFGGGGGVTFSGGECLCQRDFMREVLLGCRENGINTLIETALCVPEENVRELIPLSDEVYCDVKHMDGSVHRRLTGQSNDVIISNLRIVSGLGVRFSVRCPLIPGMNDDFENLERTARLAHEVGAENFVLLAYNPLGESKYAPIGREKIVSLGEVPESQTEEALKRLCGELNRAIGADGYTVYLK